MNTYKFKKIFRTWIAPCTLQKQVRENGALDISNFSVVTKVTFVFVIILRSACIWEHFNMSLVNGTQFYRLSQFYNNIYEICAETTCNLLKLRQTKVSQFVMIHWLVCVNECIKFMGKFVDFACCALKVLSQCPLCIIFHMA